LKKGAVIHHARIIMNHEKGTGTAAPYQYMPFLEAALSGGASPFFMTGTGRELVFPGNQVITRPEPVPFFTSAT
jgi:hypothetical protein